MTDKEKDKILNNYKTSCCKEGYYRKGRADFRCNKCDADITMELLFLYQALD